MFFYIKITYLSRLNNKAFLWKEHTNLTIKRGGALTALEKECLPRLGEGFYPAGASGVDGPLLYKGRVFFSIAARTIDKAVLLFLWMTVKFYKVFLSPFLGSRCRFLPTCSCYALLSVKKHSSFVALFKIIKRLIKCHPFHPGGYDPL